MSVRPAAAAESWIDDAGTGVLTSCGSRALLAGAVHHEVPSRSTTTSGISRPARDWYVS